VNSIDYFRTAKKWPRVVRIVQAYCNDRMLAARYVTKAAAGERLYIDVVRAAFARRHKKGVR